MYTKDEMIEMFGGLNNLIMIEHCNTRLRLTLRDVSKVSSELLYKTYSDQVHFILGPQNTLFYFNLLNDLDLPNYVQITPSSNSITLYFPVNGVLTDNRELDDDVFSEELLGPTYSFKSIDGNFYSPVDAYVSNIFPTNHSYTLTTEDNIELLIHLGVQSYNADIDNFTSFVKKGEKVVIGQKICNVNTKNLMKLNIDNSIVLIVKDPKFKKSNKQQNQDILDILEC